MKIKNGIVTFLAATCLLSSCYEDLSNYDYIEINEIEVKGIKNEYSYDLDEIMIIEPQLEGTLYSDTTLFNFEWTIDGNVVGSSLNLNLPINLATGQRKGKFTITEKQNQVKTFTNFMLNISSPTAGDLIVVLSKYKSHAEISYLRLDRPSEFTVNFLGLRYDKIIGSEPQQLAFMDLKTEAQGTYPFTSIDGRMAALIDNKVFMFDKSTLGLDTVRNYLTGSDYVSIAAYPAPDVSKYSSQFIMSAISMWRIVTGGVKQEGGAFTEISEGYVYKFSFVSNNPDPKINYQIKNEGYNACNYSAFCFYDMIADTENKKNYPAVQGNDLGNIIVFDKSTGKFGYVVDGSASASDIPTAGNSSLPAFGGHEMIYGSDTNENGMFFAVLKDKDEKTKMLIISKNAATPKAPYSLLSQINTSNVIKNDAKFYTMKYIPNVFFTTGNMLYCYNIIDAKDGIAPSGKDMVASLADFGYDSNAIITDIAVSRSERTMLLGVSRYNGDTSASSDELKGDIVVLNLDKSNTKVTLNKIYKGVCGIPTDVAFKYQNHYRNGVNYVDGKIIDVL